MVVCECDLFLAGCGWVWVSVTFFGWVWVDVGECGWVWVSAWFITAGCKMQVGVLRYCKLCSEFMMEPWKWFRGYSFSEILSFLHLEDK